MKLRTKDHAFNWDPHKARLNLRKHGVSFETAASVFDDFSALTLHDWLHSHAENRWIIYGRTSYGQLLTVVHTHIESKDRETTIRLISARAASARERIYYESGGHMIREAVPNECRDFGGYEPRNFFRGGHCLTENGVFRMSIYLDYTVLRYYAKRASMRNENPRDIINDILRKEIERLEAESPIER